MSTEPTRLINTYDQLLAAGGGVAICYMSDVGRGGTGQFWYVIRYNTKGQALVTDDVKNPPWYAYGRKRFYIRGEGTFHENKKAVFTEAQAWASAKYGVKEWARNRMGDYVSAEINARFPIPPRENVGAK